MNKHFTNTNNPVDFPKYQSRVMDMYHDAQYRAGACQGASEELVQEEFAKMIVHECIRLFGVTRTEPSLEKFILERLEVKL